MISFYYHTFFIYVLSFLIYHIRLLFVSAYFHYVIYIYININIHYLQLSFKVLELF